MWKLLEKTATGRTAISGRLATNLRKSGKAFETMRKEQDLARCKRYNMEALLFAIG